MEPVRVEFELPRDLLEALHIGEGDLSARAREWVVLELLQEGEISTGKAAELLGLSSSGLLALLAQRRLPYLDATPEELQRELEAAQAAAQLGP